MKFSSRRGLSPVLVPEEYDGYKMPAVPDNYLPPVPLTTPAPVTAVSAWATTEAATAADRGAATTEVAWRADTQIQVRQVCSSELSKEQV